ncbi:MAG: flagellar biosynthesis regulator FlaF [Rhodobacteraceae bacterium]|nr:flagellar biosynthesis regulator FlaF [Paracoccaceae bacterium]
MTPLSQARAAYAGHAQPTRTARGTEYELFARVTHRLKSAEALGRDGFAALAGALHDNRQLWTALAGDVASPGNALPAALRARIFYLAEFTALHSSRVLAREAGPGVLIEINTAMMRGLRAGAAGSGGGEGAG